MKITKYEHACLDVEQDGRHLVIDPGIFSVSYEPDSNIDIVVITHVHGDHFDPNRLRKIREKNPNVKIYGPSQVVEKGAGLEIESISAGQQLEFKPFRLEFFGGKHELYEDFENVGVLVNDTLYHPGDSYTQPMKLVKVLAAPASAPWLRISEATEFIITCKPELVFPIHTSLLSEIGETIHYRILSEAAEKIGSRWQVLKPTEFISI